MKHIAFYISFFSAIFLNAGYLAAQQLDSLQADRMMMRCVQIGIGYSNVFDTYLSTQEYKGGEFRVLSEMMRLKKGNPHLSIQSLFQTDFSYTHNRTEKNNTLAGLLNWNYGMHYQFRVSDHLKLLVGGLGDMNLGFVYNLHNSNNPASARAYINLDASGMAIWHFKIKNTPFILRYQLNIPVAGLMFSPEMGETYYEIFSLGNTKHVIQFTSLYNQPSLRQFLSLDIPLGSKQIRLSYVGDMQQSHVNNIKTHTYSHVFMVGFVKQLYRVRPKEMRKLPANLLVY